MPEQDPTLSTELREYYQELAQSPVPRDLKDKIMDGVDAGSGNHSRLWAGIGGTILVGSVAAAVLAVGVLGHHKSGPAPGTTPAISASPRTPTMTPSPTAPGTIALGNCCTFTIPPGWIMRSNGAGSGLSVAPAQDPPHPAGTDTTGTIGVAVAGPATPSVDICAAGASDGPAGVMGPGPNPTTQPIVVDGKSIQMLVLPGMFNLTNGVGRQFRVYVNEPDGSCYDIEGFERTETDMTAANDALILSVIRSFHPLHAPAASPTPFVPDPTLGWTGHITQGTHFGYAIPTNWDTNYCSTGPPADLLNIGAPAQPCTSDAGGPVIVQTSPSGHAAVSPSSCAPNPQSDPRAVNADGYTGLRGELTNVPAGCKFAGYHEILYTFSINGLDYSFLLRLAPGDTSINPADFDLLVQRTFSAAK